MPESNKVEFTDDEIAWLKRPLSDEDRAEIKGFPPLVAEHYMRRKRADGLVKRRRDLETADHAQVMADVFTAMAQDLRSR